MYQHQLLHSTQKGLNDTEKDTSVFLCVSAGIMWIPIVGVRDQMAASRLSFTKPLVGNLPSYAGLLSNGSECSEIYFAVV